jgi:hypothetical protein
MLATNGWTSIKSAGWSAAAVTTNTYVSNGNGVYVVSGFSIGYQPAEHTFETDELAQDFLKAYAEYLI